MSIFTRMTALCHWCLFLGVLGSVVLSPAPVAPEEPPEKLSAYGLFQGNGATQQPAPGVLPYDLNTPLFADYTEKFRFLRIPPGSRIQWREEEPLEFPIGTLLVKTFAMPKDLRDPAKGRRLLETRILKREPDGWVGLPYVWNEEQTEATLLVAGDTCDVAWIHNDGQRRTNNYIIPNTNQCKGCHEQNRVMQPLGPRVRHLNRDFAYADGTENQLVRLQRLGWLAGTPARTAWPRTPVWNDPARGSLEQRARAWLEVNCAHCHNPVGPARTSGLDLRMAQTEPHAYGIFKAPIAAGRGSGGRSFDIVPGKPDESILVFRLESTEAGVMMPELPRRLVDQEGTALIREWIASMKKTGK
jgi:uncharacterized repeat protein (TIGR03806 family)